ncbi:MAG TPA: hypothetical protein VI248_21670 [Kineosporiaceae bacterium]
MATATLGALDAVPASLAQASRSLGAGSLRLRVVRFRVVRFLGRRRVGLRVPVRPAGRRRRRTIPS